MTNIAHAQRTNPTIFSRIGGLVWMGGTLDRPGNTSPVAEFNCFADPYAAAQILDAVKAGEFQCVMAPLDITTPHDVPFVDLIHPSIVRKAAQATASLQDTASPAKAQKIAHEAAPSPLEEFIGNMLLRVRGLQASFGLPDAMEMHDPVAVWYAVQNAELALIGTAQQPNQAGATESENNGFKLQQREFKVERNGELTRGMCVVDRRGTGESGGDNDRTKGELGKGGDVNGSSGSKGQAEQESEEEKKRKAQADPTTDRMGQKVEKPKQLPYIITQTPGKEVLRKMLLERVFGRQV